MLSFDSGTLGSEWTNTHSSLEIFSDYTLGKYSAGSYASNDQTTIGVWEPVIITSKVLE